MKVYNSSPVKTLLPGFNRNRSTLIHAFLLIPKSFPIISLQCCTDKAILSFPKKQTLLCPTRFLLPL